MSGEDKELEDLNANEISSIIVKLALGHDI